MPERQPQQPAPVVVRRLPAAPDRPDDAHKGTFGTVIVIGGSETMIGAPALCATAAFRAGAGLVKVAAPRGVIPFVLTIEPSATGLELAPAGFARAMDRVDAAGRAVLAVGPGMGRSQRAAALVRHALRGPRAVVLDADGLNLLAETAKTLRQLRGDDCGDVVLTPHPGEFARLAKPLGITASATDPAQRPLAAAMLALAQGCTVVLKGRHTLITDGHHLAINRTGNPALATAGSGDVLTGVIASLMAQGMQAFDAARLGVHLHGMAADIWASKNGRSGLTARDLATLIPEAFQRHRRMR